jgi:hypothetical protein
MRLILLLVPALLLAAPPVAAQDYVRADCLGKATPARYAAGSPEARWYRRFWTGDCDGLFGCMGGSPNWNEVVGKLLERSPAAARTAVLAKACRLGPLIGMEWVRPKKVRRIDTGDLKGFNKTLERAGDVLRGLDAVDAEVRGKLGG